MAMAQVQDRKLDCTFRSADVNTIAINGCLENLLDLAVQMLIVG